MASFDPAEKIGFGWKRYNDGSVRKLVVHEGRYCLEDEETRKLKPIPNAVPPRRDEYGVDTSNSFVVPWLMIVSEPSRDLKKGKQISVQGIS
ncbi:uncharacterized protein Z518_05402 [Rhinocladiella mackenziei CBS 650.93]|uniref:Uncharacterized protein n=1 Tax=Rhinocladiella mackenziei CBS 650.93 TaxID=1442369 RepID=A0A0D2FQU5_9EURO|nr:uncharacterized protein Z518_05402 [Rhinocladiella mackenziei CBS 650.93]KIX04532.1 hypothetical protein Z518_05402 [Rhinocladiella mackenziei CBS 650.93]